MKSLRRCCISVALVLPLACPLLAPAQWEKKPSTQWSEKEAQKVLDDSPWGQTQVISDTSQMFDSGRRLDSGQSRVANTFHVNFRIRFLSAKPIRQAVSRVMELRQKGNLDEQLAARLKAFAAADFPDYVVVTVLCDAEQRSNQFQEALSLLSSLTTAELKNNTFLEVKGGQRIFIQEYQSPRNDGLGARFVFPRLVGGEPFITPESGEIRFYSELSTRRPGSPTYTLNMRFKIAAMIYEGRLEY